MNSEPIWILGEPDNRVNHELVNYLQKRYGARLIFILAIRPSIKRDFGRFKRKLMNAGILSTLARVILILKNRYVTHAASSGTSGDLKETKSKANMQGVNFEYVDSLGSSECFDLIRRHSIKYFLAATDAIVPSSLIRSTPRGIWNAHPGAVPKYRGLGASDRMLADGYFPVISLHLIDEGVDTGPVLFEVKPDFTNCKNINEVYAATSLAQLKALADLVEVFDRKNEIKFRDDFFSHSSISHQNTRQIRRKVSLIKNISSLKEYESA